MGYNKLIEIIKDDVKLTSFITNISSGYLDIPYIMEETLKVLDDDSPMFNLISESNKKALCIMMDMYFTDCWALYIEDTPLDKLLQYGKIEVYKVEAANGLRYATINEVAQGIKGLIGEYIYPAGEDEYKKLCLLYWTFTGKSYYYRQAGFELNYNNNGKVTTPFYLMVQNCALQLKELFKWVSMKDEVAKAIKKMDKMKKNKGYKYASFEKDEITEDVTIKQLVYNIYKIFPRNSPNVEYRKALALALKYYKDKKQLSPLEISMLRETYDKHAIDKNRNQQIDDGSSAELKETCELLLRERYSGKIDSNDFAYKIIETLKKNNYNKCSIKQYEFLDKALKLINRDTKEEKEENNKTEVISDTEIDSSLESLSDAIGNGLFEDDEDC